MRLKNIVLNFVIGVISCAYAVPIQVIYTGDSCDCPKHLNYMIDKPLPPRSKFYKPSEYGYKLDVPVQAKAEVTYSFDFEVEEPRKPLPPRQDKWELYAKVDRVTAHKKDCYHDKEARKTCGCSECLHERYVSPENRITRYSRNSGHPNSIDYNNEPSTSQVMAIFLEPSNRAQLGASKSRNKRDLSRIFVRPRKNEKRSERTVKKYNKRLADINKSESRSIDAPSKPLRARSIAKSQPGHVRSLQQLKSFLKLPRYRNRRDIKGEYDLIEKDREQMDLTLPEIIQYMPETLNPNFKRNQCHFGQQCRKENSLNTETTTTSSNEPLTTTVKTTIDDEATTIANMEKNDSSSEISSSNNSTNKEKLDENQEEFMDNDISSGHKKRNAGNYDDGVGGCPLVFNGHNPTPNPTFTLEPLPNYDYMPRPFGTAHYPYGPDPAPQQYVGAPYNPYAPAILDNFPLVGSAYSRAPSLQSFADNSPLVGSAYSGAPNVATSYSPTSSIQSFSNAELDRIIGDIVNRHPDFLDAISHRGGGLVAPVSDQEEQTKSYLFRNLMGHWNSGSASHPSIHYDTSPHYHAQPFRAHVHRHHTPSYYH